MAYDQRLYGVAQRYYLLALHACREGSCPELGAKVIGDMTQLSTALGRYDDSLGMVRTALYSLPRQASRLVRSDLLGLESRAYAQLGDSEAGNADRSAQTCVAVYEEAPRHAAHAPDWIHYMNQSEVDCLAANAYIELALSASRQVPAAALRHQRPKSTRCAPARTGNQGYVRSRVFDEIRLAKVRLAQREPAESAAVGMHALRLAADTRSSLVVNWLTSSAATSTARHPDEPEARPPSTSSFATYLRKAAPASPSRGRVNARPTSPSAKIDGEQAAAAWASCERSTPRYTPSPLMSGATSTPPCSPSASRSQRRQDGFALVEARHGDRPGRPRLRVTLPGRSTARGWQNLTTALPPEVTAERPGRTFALVELLVRAPWRRQHVAQAMHDLLLHDRPEERATLTVLPAAAPAQAAYRKWGWRKVAQKRLPLPGSPLFDVLVKQLAHPGTPS